MNETGALAHCNALSHSLHQYARSLRVCWSDRACGGIRLKNWSVCQQRDARLCIHSWNVCLTHSVLFRCHSPMVVRCLTCRSIENVGAIFSSNVVLSFHPCSARVPEGTVLIFAPWMPSPCEVVRLLRSTRRLRWSATADLSRSSVSSTTCGSLGPSSAIMHNEVAPERGLPPTAVAEVKWKLFSLIGEGLTRCWEQRVRDQNVCSLCAIIPGLPLLQRTRPGVLPYRPRAPREAARVNRVRVDRSASSFPEKAGGVTGLLRHAGTQSNGHRGGFTRRAVEAWHVHCRHALRSGAFDNMKSHRWKSVRGPLETLQCCGVDVVGATCLLSARKPLRAWSEQRAARFLSPSSRSRRTPSTPSMPGWRYLKNILLFPRKTLFFSCADDCLRDCKLSSSLLRAVTLLSESSLCTFSWRWPRPRDIRCINQSPIFTDFSQKNKKKAEKNMRKKKKLNKKVFRERWKRTFFFRTKIR